MLPVANSADDASNCLQIHKVWHRFQGRILPEAIFILHRIAGFDVCKEDSFISRLVNFEGSREVELNHTLKLAEKGLMDRILGFVVVGIAVDEAFVLQWCERDEE